MRTSDLNRRIRIERPAEGTDDWGQPVQGWELVAEVWAGIANETGLGAIRSSLAGGVPASIARYSFMVRLAALQSLAVDESMRIVHEGMIFEVKGVTRDLKDRAKGFIITEQGGNSG